MYRVDLMSLLNNEHFIKRFESPYLLDKFLNKCKYSKKVVVIGVIKEY